VHCSKTSEVRFAFPSFLNQADQSINQSAAIRQNIPSMSSSSSAASPGIPVLAGIPLRRTLRTLIPYTAPVTSSIRVTCHINSIAKSVNCFHGDQTFAWLATVCRNLYAAEFKCDHNSFQVVSVSTLVRYRAVFSLLLGLHFF
jgi:hypothetical protein